ncbi:MAG: hypothetical protein ABIH63_03790 [archaeon]
MSKKGAASHVDWAISIGLFVVYTLLLFIFLRPGIQPVYSQSNLLKIVESGFNSDAKYSIDKIPFFIRPNGNNFPSAPGNYQLAVENVDFPFQGYDEENFSLILLNRSELPFEMEFNIPPGNRDALRFNSTFNGNNVDYTFFLLYSTEHRYGRSWGRDSNRLLYKPGQGNQPDIINFTYEFGVREAVKGLSYDKLDSLTADYDAIKVRWKFPSDKDFSLVATTLEDNQVIKEVNNIRLPTNVNVYANTYLDWVLEPDTTFVPVNVTIRVW